MKRFLLVGVLCLTMGDLAVAQGDSEKRALDHDAYDVWQNISGQKISDDGQWVLYTTSTQDGDPSLTVVNPDTGTTYTVPEGTSGAFTPDSIFVVCKLKVKKEVTRQAKRDKVKKKDMPKDGLAILDLRSGEVESVERVKSYKVAEEGGPWVAYLLEKSEETKEEPEEETPEAEASEEEESSEENEDEEEEDKKEDGTTLIVRRLNREYEILFDYVSEYAFSKNGELLAVATSSESEEHDGVQAFDLVRSNAIVLSDAAGAYKKIAVSEDANRVAFVSDMDSPSDDPSLFELYGWKKGDSGASRVSSSNEPFDDGWGASEFGDVWFSESGTRLYFGVAPLPEAEPEEEPLEDEEVKVDVWNWRDAQLQPMQLVNLKDEQERTYSAVVHLESGKVVQLASALVPELKSVSKGDASFVLGASDRPYRRTTSWDLPGYRDLYGINVETGERELLIEKLHGDASLSPGAQFVYWWDRHGLAWMSYEVETGEQTNMTSAIPYPLQDELHDRPMPPGAYGMAGWTEHDESILIYDKHDIWACDPRGVERPRNVTLGIGREHDLRFRVADLDPDEVAIAKDASLLLNTFDYVSRDSGFYRTALNLVRPPMRLVMGPKFFGTPIKSREQDRLLFTRMSFQEFPDLWVSSLDLGNTTKISDVNPQQKDYLWGTSELVSWTSATGEELEGILYKPEGFDSATTYPMMVYFYERLSNSLNRYYTPQAVRASINVSFYVSRGYLVFIPDIPYREGYPGESSMHAVVPGVLDLIDEGFVDKERIGVQGHSWGGYQAAYLITRTNLFAAAEAGAPVSNMTSAYGGIRWATGMSRMFQYERTQSRIGGSLWERPREYIENSPLFWADKIETPLLMMHNDEDGAVPWYQGIELFVAMRRLDKPVWMLNYNGEPHGLTKYQNKRDWAIRMQQFFDHYLKDAPAPIWLEEGVPALRKGKTLGLEAVSAE